MQDKITLAGKFARFDAYWTPKIISEMNGQYIKLVKLKGESVWHTHDNGDEYFQVIRAR